MSTHPAPPAPTYARRLGLFSATMLVVGGIVGSGIFLNPAVVARRAGTAGLTLGVWAAGAVVALLGATIFAELGRRRPRAGGGYAYLREAFGPLPAFLYGWALLLVIASGAIAAVAMTFAGYAAALVGAPPSAERPLALGAVVLLTLVNVRGVAPGAVLQNVFTVLKLAALAALVGAALLAPALAPGAAPAAAAPAAPNGLLAAARALGTALVPVLFAYGGWQQTNFVAEELDHPERNLPRALALGTAVVVAVYLLANVAYLRTLGVAGLAASAAPAADTMARAAGPAGRTLVSAGIAASTFGFLDLVILVSPRVYQAMARDGLFFAAFARLHPRYRTPAAATLGQGAWACALLLVGSYGALLDYVTFADWTFFGLTAAALVVLRRRDARAARDAAGGTAADRGYRAPFYPWSVAAFVAAALYVVAGAVASSPANAGRGALLLLAGVPAFAVWRRGQAGGGSAP